MNSNPRSISDGLAEAQRYFSGQGALNYALAQLAIDLKSHNIDYVLIGAVALLAHGYRRFTENINLVVTSEGLEAFRQELLGIGGYGLSGYLRADSNSEKSFLSHPLNIRIDVMTTGEYPGDGKPKPVSIPEPAAASIEMDGIQIVTLEKLIELKLASGMTAPDRLKDLADVQELIKIRNLQKDFAQRLDPYVRDKFLELLDAVEKSKSA